MKKKLVRLVLVSLLLVPLIVDDSPAHAQSEVDATGAAAAAAPAASATSVPRAVPKYADASIGFEFEYKVDNAAACVAWPEELQNAACDGLDYHNLVAYASAFTAARGPLIRSMAYLRFDNDNTATLAVDHTPDQIETRPDDFHARFARVGHALREAWFTMGGFGR